MTILNVVGFSNAHKCFLQDNRGEGFARAVQNVLLAYLLGGAGCSGTVRAEHWVMLIACLPMAVAADY